MQDGDIGNPSLVFPLGNHHHRRAPFLSFTFDPPGNTRWGDNESEGQEGEEKVGRTYEDGGGGGGGRGVCWKGRPRSEGERSSISQQEFTEKECERANV